MPDFYSPLFWLESDIWEYIRRFEVPYCKVYDMGYVRTGCIYCMYGAHLDGLPNRFQRLQHTHPKLWRYCMRDWEAGALACALFWNISEFLMNPFPFNFLVFGRLVW